MTPKPFHPGDPVLSFGGNRLEVIDCEWIENMKAWRCTARNIQYGWLVQGAAKDFTHDAARKKATG